MDRRYRGVLLDVDGTLVDSNDAHAHAWDDAFKAHGLDVAYDRIRGSVGMGGDHLIEQLTGLPPGDAAHRALADDQQLRFRDHWLATVRPFPGTRELLIRLREAGYEYAIASSAKNEQLEPLLAIAEIYDLCEIRATSSDATHSKPDPDIIEAAVARLGLARSQVVLLGDTPYDVTAARRAHVDTIGVTSGGFSVEQLAGAIAVFSGVSELLTRWRESPLAIGS